MTGRTAPAPGSGQCFNRQSCDDFPSGDEGSRLSRYGVSSQRLRWEPSSEATALLLPWVVCIAVLLMLGVLYIASSLLVPLAISLVAYLALRPFIARLCRLGLAQTPASAILIIACFSIIAALAATMYQPLQTWLDEAPESLARLKANFHDVAKPLTTVDRAEQQLDQATVPLEGTPRRLEIEFTKPSIVDPQYLINTTGHVLAFIAAIAVMTFFMLCSGDDLLNRILNVLPDQAKRTRVLETISEVQDNVGRYLGQITMINVGLGVGVTLVMWAVGMPTPYLWGAMACLFNFVPYVGPIAGTGLVLVAAASVFDSFPRAIFIAVAFWMTTAIEGQFVTPSVLGKTLKVGSLMVLVAVAFWGFLWGLPGVLLAVPLLIVMRQVFASLESTYPIAVVLGEDPCKPGDDCEPVKEDEPIAEAV